MELNFFGKTALITGASQGIGRDIAENLARGGAKVIAVARSKELLESLQQKIPSIKTLALDLSDWSATEKAFENIEPIDLLVNNAAYGMIKPITDFTEEEIDKLLAINVKAVMHVTQIVVKQMIARNTPGAIVNVSSQASLAGFLYHGAYTATKGAVDAYTRAAAVELGPHNIRVNCVNPTVVLTEMGKKFWSDPKLAEPMKEKHPLRRFAEIQEVVDVVLYLLSDKSSMVNGVTFPVEGGYLAA